MRDGFIKVAAGTPRIRVADCHYNAEQIFTLMRQAAGQGVRVLCLPELCLTGYTCADLFFHDTLLQGAEEALSTVLEATRNLDMITALGMPVRGEFDNKLYNCAVVIHKGKILGVVPKTNLVCHSGKNELRWFSAPAECERTVSLCGTTLTMSTCGTFACSTMPGLVIGVEIGEDLWAAVPPSTELCRSAGATVILNPSATCEIVGRADFRRTMVTAHSAKMVCGYVCAEAGEGESTTDVVYTGHGLIAENGTMLSERRFAGGLTISEIDVDKLIYERRRMNTYAPGMDAEDYWRRPFALDVTPTKLTRYVAPSPFVPEDSAERAERCNEILYIAASGLKKRIEHTHAKKAVVGLSGGLDSTLAILITALAMRMLGRPSTDILAITMPCFGTTDRTRDNAVELAERLGATLKRIDIGEAVQQHFKDIGQSMDNHDVTFENGQARERTQVLMDVANQCGGMVIGTGDLSELALGWPPTTATT